MFRLTAFTAIALLSSPLPAQNRGPAVSAVEPLAEPDPGWVFRRQQTRADSLLAAGDTTAAIEELRFSIAREKSRRQQCLLASLLTRRVTNRADDWEPRNEAQILFRAALSRDPEPGCLLAFAELKEKQQAPGDARRLAKQALELVIKRPELATPSLYADLYFRRAQPLVTWIRNFENLVVVTDLPVSTANCLDTGSFCLAFTNPALFYERLARGTRLDHLVEDQRRAVRDLLDSALAIDPAHPGAVRLALRGAAVAADWKGYEALARRAHAADPISVTPMLGIVTALVRQKRLPEAGVAFDSLLGIIGPEALAQMEGLALVADSTIRDRLRGQSHVVYADAVWGLSDPLYLTPYNERRLEHYSRIMLADVLFTDWGSGAAGRDTEQGRLVLRYGLPWRWIEVKADKSLELSPSQREQLATITELSKCNAMSLGSRASGDQCIPVVAADAGPTLQGGGRWIFWFYGPDAPPMIFERQLGYLTARHMQFTRSRELDSALYHAAPSTFESPYTAGNLQALITRFPRPGIPVVEVQARFDWPGAHVVRDSVRWGVVMHDPVNGRETGRSRVRASVTDSAARLGEQVIVPRGRSRLAVEVRTLASDAAGQLRMTIEMSPPPAGTLAMSDLLLGDSADAPARIERRSDVRFHARTDSVYAGGSPVALYWEVYGMSADTALGPSRFRVNVRIEDAGGRTVGYELWRGATRLLGLRSTNDNTVEWEEERPNTYAIVPGLLTLTAPRDSGQYKITVTVTDVAGGRVAVSERKIWLQ